MRWFIIVATLCLLFVHAATAGPVDTLRRYYEAFEAHDADGMAMLVTDDVEWLNMNEGALQAEARGREDLRAALRDYFESQPGVAGYIEELVRGEGVLALRERVFWVREDRGYSQAAIAVYEFAEERIRRVVYYPAFDRHLGSPAVRIGLRRGTDEERQARAQLERVLGAHDLEPWLYTRRIMIEENTIPHSHPVLTLSTARQDDDHAKLASLIHEQLHWFVTGHDAAMRAAVEDLRRLYPDAPKGRPLGARDEYSTYMHLALCWLEYRVTAGLIGEAAARAVLDGYTHYPWVYEKVLKETARIGEIVRAHGLDAPLDAL